MGIRVIFRPMMIGFLATAGVFSEGIFTLSEAAQSLSWPTAPMTAPEIPSLALGLRDLVQLTEERNPRIARAAFAVEAARGRAVQAGLYPNPTVEVSGAELGDRAGPGGIWTAPLVSQEIVTAGKLKLSRAAALREVDQATLAVLAERYNRFTAVRQGYFEVLTLSRRLKLLDELLKLAERSVETTKELLKAKQAARLDLIQMEIEVERYRAEREATQRELPLAFRRLVAGVGVPALPYATLTGSLEQPVPEYDFDKARRCMLETHPELLSAKVEVDRTNLLLRRAQAEPIPNVNIGAGYLRQNQNRSDDWVVTVTVPLPLWNRNQGNIAAAQARVGEAVQNVCQVENELVGRLAGAFRAYAAAKQRADHYRTAILPRARETYQLSMTAYQIGQSEYLKVLEAQRTVAQADLEYNRTLGEMWQSASEIAGLLLEDEWPVATVPPAMSCPQP